MKGTRTPPQALARLLVVAACACGAGGRGRPVGGDPEAIASGGRIRMSWAREPPFLNPLYRQVYDRVTPLLFEGLIAVDREGELVPVLAERWEVSADGLVLTFHLRRGVTWHDGEPFTSGDVAFSLDAIRGRKLDLGEGPIESPFSAGFALVERVESPDAHTVRVTYRQPFGPALASFLVGIVPAHVYGRDLAAATRAAPVGTGPFRFAGWSRGESITVVANEAHWAGRPRLDAIVLSGQPESVEALLGDRLDLVETLVPVASDDPALAGRVESGVYSDAESLALVWNTERPPYRDARVRVALAHALDRGRVIREVLRGGGRPSSAPFLYPAWGADRALAPWPFDLARARALLAEAGVPLGSGRRLTLTVLIGESWRGSVFDRIFPIFREDLAAIGVDLVVEHRPIGEIVGRLGSGDFDAAVLGLGANAPDPDPFDLLHSSRIGLENYARYRNAEVDRLLEEGRRGRDRARREALYRRLHALLHAEQPYTMLYSVNRSLAWVRRLRGVHAADLGNFPAFPGPARWWLGP